MSLKTLLGARPAPLPEGWRYALDTLPGTVSFVIRAVPPGQEDLLTCQIVGPGFTSHTKAGEYREWLEGTRAHFDYGDRAV